jgi:glycosyltransferase involved in cell wall biosynthesis
MSVEDHQHMATGNGSTAPTMPIPILLTVRELHHGGVEHDVTKIAIHIDRSKFEPHVASYGAEGIRFEELRRAGVPILHLPVTSLRSPSALSAAIRLRRYIREHGIRLVHSYDPSAVFVAPIARVLRVPAVLCSTLGYRSLHNHRTRTQLRWVDKIVDTVVVNCEAMRHHMIHDEQFPDERIMLCYNGVNTNLFCAAPASLPDAVADASFVIGTVCVLRPEKALGLLQEAFARIRHLRPGMKLLVVGSGPELPQLQANSQRLGLQNDCVFLPTTAVVTQFLRSFDIFVVCSRSEAFPNALLEAMACGCCVAGSRVGGIPEMIGNDERGLLFDSDDVSDLAEKLTTLIRDERLRCGLGSRAADFARTRFSIEIAARRMSEIYETTLGRKTGLWKN